MGPHPITTEFINGISHTASVFTTFRPRPKYRSYGSDSDRSNSRYLSTELGTTYKYIVTVKVTGKNEE